MHHPAGDRVAIAGAELTLFITNAKRHASTDHVADLLVGVRVRRDLSVGLDQESDDHHLIAAGQNAATPIINLTVVAILLVILIASRRWRDE